MNQLFLDFKSLARASTLLFNSPGFWATPFSIFNSLLNVPITMKFLVTQIQAPPPSWIKTNNYFFKVKRRKIRILSYSVVLLIVKSNSGFVLANSMISEGLQEVQSLVDDNFMSNAGILFVNQIEFVLGHRLNRKIGSADGSFSWQ